MLPARRRRRSCGRRRRRRRNTRRRWPRPFRRRRCWSRSGARPTHRCSVRADRRTRESTSSRHRSIRTRRPPPHRPRRGWRRSGPPRSRSAARRCSSARRGSRCRAPSAAWAWRRVQRVRRGSARRRTSAAWRTTRALGGSPPTRASSFRRVAQPATARVSTARTRARERRIDLRTDIAGLSSGCASIRARAPALRGCRIPSTVA